MIDGPGMHRTNQQFSSPQTADERAFLPELFIFCNSPYWGLLGFYQLWDIVHAWNGPGKGNGVILANTVAYLLSVSRYSVMTMVIVALDEHKRDKEGVACSA